MKTRGNAFYALLLGVAVAIPVVGHTVTLPSANKTPCYFGAMGGPVACLHGRTPNQSNSRSGLGITSVAPTSVIPSAVTPRPTAAVMTTTLSTPVSEVVSGSKPASAQTAAVSPPSAVPLPLGAALLFGSLGLMVLVHRKKA